MLERAYKARRQPLGAWDLYALFEYAVNPSFLEALAIAWGVGNLPSSLQLLNVGFCYKVWPLGVKEPSRI